MAITDVGTYGIHRVLERARELCALGRPGSVVVQLRDPAMELRERFELGCELQSTTSRFGQLLAVNDRLDLCTLLGAEVLHLGERSIPPIDARAFLNVHLPGCRISVACHDPGQTPPAEVDAVVLSPIIAARKGRDALAMQGLRELRTQQGAWSMVALGGVEASSARACLDAGADGVAAIGAWLEGDLRALLTAIGSLR